MPHQRQSLPSDLQTLPHFQPLPPYTLPSVHSNIVPSKDVVAIQSPPPLPTMATSPAPAFAHQSAEGQTPNPPQGLSSPEVPAVSHPHPDALVQTPLSLRSSSSFPATKFHYVSFGNFDTSFSYSGHVPPLSFPHHINPFVLHCNSSFPLQGSLQQ